MGLFLLLALPMISLVSSETILNIQTAPYMDVWVTAMDAGENTLKVPELYSVDMCGRAEIIYDISETDFYFLLRVKDGDSLFYQEEFDDKFYRDTEINLTALPEDYELSLPSVCSEVEDSVSSNEENDSSSEIVALSGAQNENESANESFDSGLNLETENSERGSSEENSGFFITGYSFVRDNVLSKNTVLYLLLFILIVLIIYLAAKNKRKDHLIHEYQVSNKFPVRKNQKKINKLKKKIEKYEKEIIKLRQEDLNPNSKEKFRKKKLKRRDVLGSEKDDRVHVSDLDLSEDRD